MRPPNASARRRSASATDPVKPTFVGCATADSRADAMSVHSILRGQARGSFAAPDPAAALVHAFAEPRPGVRRTLASRGTPRARRSRPSSPGRARSAWRAAATAASSSPRESSPVAIQPSAAAPTSSRRPASGSSRASAAATSPARRLRRASSSDELGRVGKALEGVREHGVAFVHATRRTSVSARPRERSRVVRRHLDEALVLNERFLDQAEREE